MQTFKNIHHPAVWLAIVVQQAIGTGFYTVLAEPWMSLNQLVPADLNGGILPVIVSFLTRITLTYFVAWLLVRLQSDSIFFALKIGFLIWFCIILAVILPHYAFAQKSYWLSAIDAGSDFLTLLAGVLILQLWQKKATVAH